MLSPIRVYLGERCLETVGHLPPDLMEYISVEVDLLLRIGVVQVSLELLKADFVATFKSTILTEFDLDGIVSQVNLLGRQVIERELLGRGAQVAVMVDETFDIRVD